MAILVFIVVSLPQQLRQYLKRKEREDGKGYGLADVTLQHMILLSDDRLDQLLSFVLVHLALRCSLLSIFDNPWFYKKVRAGHVHHCFAYVHVRHQEWYEFLSLDWWSASFEVLLLPTCSRFGWLPTYDYLQLPGLGRGPIRCYFVAYPCAFGMFCKITITRDKKCMRVAGCYGFSTLSSVATSLMYFPDCCGAEEDGVHCDRGPEAVAVSNRPCFPPEVCGYSWGNCSLGFNQI